MGWQKQKKEEKRQEGKKQRKEKKNPKKQRKIEVRKVAEKWKIWEEEKKAAKLEEEARKLVPENFHK